MKYVYTLHVRVKSWAIIKLLVTCSLILHNHSKFVTLRVNPKQQGISPIASRESQAYSAVTGVKVAALNDSLTDISYQYM